MSRRAKVKPDDLDAMLCRWGVHGIKNRGLGFPPVSPMFRERVGKPTQAYDPWIANGEDFRELEAAIESLEQMHRDAITRAYRPWTARTLEYHYPGVSPVTWHRWLHGAAALLASKLIRDNAVY